MFSQPILKLLKIVVEDLLLRSANLLFRLAYLQIISDENFR